MPTEPGLLSFWFNSSRERLQDAMLARLAESSNLRGQVLDALELWVKAAAEAELLAILSAHGEEMARAISARDNPFVLPTKPPAKIRRMTGLKRKQLAR